MDSDIVPKAQRSGSRVQSVLLSGTLQALSQTMITRSLLVALEVERDKNIRILAEENSEFSRIITALRHGDEAIDLPVTTHPEILTKLARLEKEWSIFGPAVQSILDTGRVSPRNVAIVAECIEPLAEATSELIEVYEYYATGGQIFSVLTGMVSRADAQRAVLQEMVAGYLLIAYGHQPEIYRSILWARRIQVDQVLKGLIHGDRVLKLLPAPGAELREQFQLALRIWERLSPIMRSVARGGAVDPASIPMVTTQCEQLAAEIATAVAMYRVL